jgi:hypothetical protein
MLWWAGQKRVGREARERMTELYVGVRDGYLAARLGSKVGQPDYTHPDSGAPRARRGLTQLLGDFPGVEHGAVPGRFEN